MPNLSCLPNCPFWNAKLALDRNFSFPDITEDEIRRILTSFTFNFLTKVFAEYSEKSGEDFLELIKKKCKGDTLNAFKAICKDILGHFTENFFL